MNPLKAIKSVLRNSQQLNTVLFTQFDEIGVFLKPKVKQGFLAIVYNKQAKTDKAQFSNRLFLLKKSKMFNLTGGLRIILVMPLTVEVTITERTNGLSIKWLDYNQTQWELKSRTSSSIVKTLRKIVEDGGRYQREPFYSGSSTHTWIWYYQAHIPREVRTLDEENLGKFRHRQTVFLRPEDYGNELMETYIKHQLLKRQEEFTERIDIKIWVGTWNVAGNSPAGQIRPWIGQERADIYCFLLQEICELSAKNITGDEKRKKQWVNYLMNQLNSIYPQVNFKQILHEDLVGLLMLICCREDIYNHVRDNQTIIIKLGFKGISGTKGAICTRFSLFDSSICVINAHLAAHKKHTRARNSNIKQIIKSTRFYLNSRQYKNLYENDFIFWGGDFNYRINLSTPQILTQIQEGKLSSLSQQDQFFQQKVKHNMLMDFVEAPLNFPPTFKFFVNSNNYNTKREPAWCDRILFKGQTNQHYYSSFPQIQLSDHKPVSSIFSMQIKKVDEQTKQKVQFSILSQIQINLRNASPSISISQTSIVFEGVQYKTGQQKSIQIINRGNFPASFQITEDGEPYQRTYIEIQPTSSYLAPNECLDLKFRVFLREHQARKGNEASGNLNIKIQINILGSQTFSLPIDCHFQGSCFGSSIPILSHLEGPVLSYSTHISQTARELQEIDTGTPKELTRMIIFIESFCQKMCLFYETGEDERINQIRKCLDNGEEFPPNTDPHSMCSVLLEFLESLEQPLLTPEILDRGCSMEDFTAAYDYVLVNLEPANGRSLAFLLSFLKELCQYTDMNLLTPKFLSKIFLEPLTHSEELIRKGQRLVEETVENERAVEFLAQMIST